MSTAPVHLGRGPQMPSPLPEYTDSSRPGQLCNSLLHNWILNPHSSVRDASYTGMKRIRGMATIEKPILESVEL